MIHNHRRGGASFLADPARGWCRLSADAEPPYHENLREAWKAGRALQRVGCAPNDHGAIATLRIDGPRAHFAWLGLERVLRVRGGELVQLTIDHDLFDAARRGHAAIDPAALAALDEIPAVETRGLPADAPDEGTCDVEPGDRFVLLDVLAQRELVRAAGGHDGFVARLRDGSARDVARWMRAVLVHERVELPVVVIDADASLEARSHGAPRVSSAATTARDLVERPAEFNGWRVRFRGVYRRGMEVSTIADAWFEGTCGLGDGTWAVEAEGLWIHDGGQHGHFGQWASELRGTLTPIDLAHPRSIPPDRIGSAEPYVAYTSEIVIERGLLHWWHEGRWVTRFGRDGRFPLADPPERCRVRATFVPGAYGHLGIVEWTILDTEPLAPTRRTAASPGREGEYVEIEGMLVPTKDYPRLDDALRVSPPSLTRSPLRHTIPQHEAAARFREILGAGRRVTVRGEMGPSALLALAVFDESGPIDL